MRSSQALRGSIYSDRASATARQPISGTTANIAGDGLAREAYCLFGMPLDSLDMEGAVDEIEAAAANAVPLLLATPNVNFLSNSLSNLKFHEALSFSDLCLADGKPLIWLARLLSIPIKERVAGSDLFEMLRKRDLSKSPLTVFFFGGPDGVSERASQELNRMESGLRCVGHLSPGYGTVEELSDDKIIAQINASNADFLIVALGAGKGQAWLRHNHHRLFPPVRAHLGAVISFQAGAISRAPKILRNAGLEWLWRIKEEPHLWKRYWQDGRVLLRLLVTRVPSMLLQQRQLRQLERRQGAELRIFLARDVDQLGIILSGAAVSQHVGRAINAFRAAINSDPTAITIDLARVSHIDPRFLGLLLLLRKHLRQQGTRFRCTNASPSLRRMFRLNEATFLLADQSS